MIKPIGDMVKLPSGRVSADSRCADEAIGDEGCLDIEQRRCINQAIELGQRQIQEAIASGQVPPTVTEFGMLHQFLDANEIGGLCDGAEEIRGVFPRENAEQEAVFVAAANRVQHALDDWLAFSDDRNALLIERCVDDALHSACRAVQERLKVRSGDVAGRFFAGRSTEQLDVLLTEYVKAEIAALGDGT